jgi:hypothetical protein
LRGHVLSHVTQPLAARLLACPHINSLPPTKGGKKQSTINNAYVSPKGVILVPVDKACIPTTSIFLYKALNRSILRFNLSLLNYYLFFKLYLKRASLKRLKKRLSKRLPRLKKKSSSKLKRLTKPKSLTYDYNKSGI